MTRDVEELRGWCLWAYFQGMKETPVATWASWWPLDWKIMQMITEDQDQCEE